MLNMIKSPKTQVQSQKGQHAITSKSRVKSGAGLRFNVNDLSGEGMDPCTTSTAQHCHKSALIYTKALRLPLHYAGLHFHKCISENVCLIRNKLIWLRQLQRVNWTIWLLKSPFDFPGWVKESLIVHSFFQPSITAFHVNSTVQHKDVVVHQTLNCTN